MKEGVLTRYNASAGSGKTFRLTGAFLEILFCGKGNFREILAVTFTNRAAAEMKERILNSLSVIASGGHSDYLSMLTEKCGKQEDLIRREAREHLDSILYDYSLFSVGTIDSFFQKILRAFARESGVQAGFNLVLDPSVILSSCIDDLMERSDRDPVLLEWLTRFAFSEIESGAHWNLKRKTEELGKEIFTERFMMLFQEGRIIDDKKQLAELSSALQESVARFRSGITAMAIIALEPINRHGVVDDDLYYKSRSVKRFLEDAAVRVPEKLTIAVTAACSQEKYSSGKGSTPSLEAALADGLHKKITALADYYNSGITRYKSFTIVLRNLYTLGLLTDIAAGVRRMVSDSNSFLLSDSGNLLRQIIGNDQAPFIYEKTGNRYSVFMIDEFQDTSGIQWANFLPLIQNSLAAGEANLVVGDVKQAIYRWRNSDWRIFYSLGEVFRPDQFTTVPLNRNWRSRSGIVQFNNLVFTQLPALAEEMAEIEKGTLTSVYSDVVQEDHGEREGGYIRIEKISGGEEEATEITSSRIPLLIEEVEDMGYQAGDIGILVRTRDEGQKVIDAVMNYSSQQDDEKRKHYNYRIISQDSLLLGHNPAVKLIVSLLRYVTNRSDRLALASVKHYYRQLTAAAGVNHKRPLLIEDEENSKTSLPEGWLAFIDSVLHLSLFELIERIILFFSLGSSDASIPYITTLQDYILELSGKEAADIPLFLDWWDSEGYRKAVSSPDQEGAISLMTIHKAKGLEFKVVILPFLTWPFTHQKRQVIWVESDEKPLDELGAIPVYTSKEMTDTWFAAYYESERKSYAVDMLNLLYVALTRARDAIFGFVPEVRTKKNCGELLFNMLSNYYERENGGNTIPGSTDTSLFVAGEPPSLHADAAKRDDNGGLKLEYPVLPGRSRLRLKLESRNYLVSEAAGRTDRINYGLMMHSLFEAAQTVDDIHRGVEQMVFQGRLTVSQGEKLSGQIASVTSVKPVASWFRPGIEVRKEPGLLLPGGALKRPDRVMIDDGRVTVVDFKFGEVSDLYFRQLNQYRSLLEEMGYVNVKAYIWYVETGNVVEVER
ncbi:MAG: UvrD-helicase domain-containing protein [Bacteroidales bacterium]|nr:UvrD-helicase domain-containing protein [Bacteroidales bacterium]